MAWIDKNLLPSLRMIDSFRSMRKIRIQGIPFMENRPVKFSKTGNKFVLDFKTQIAEHNSVESAKYSNLPQFTFAHGNRSYIVPDGMSRITTYRDNILGRVSNDFSIEVEAQIIHSSKIRPDRKYFFRYFVPVEKGGYFGDYAYYYFLCQGKQAGSLIKISLPGNEIHLVPFRIQERILFSRRIGKAVLPDRDRKHCLRGPANPRFPVRDVASARGVHHRQ